MFWYVEHADPVKQNLESIFTNLGVWNLSLRYRREFTCANAMVFSTALGTWVLEGEFMQGYLQKVQQPCW